MSPEEFATLEASYKLAVAKKAGALGRYRKLRAQGSSPNQLRMHRDKYLFAARELMNVEPRYWCEMDRRDCE